MPWTSVYKDENVGGIPVEQPAVGTSASLDPAFQRMLAKIVTEALLDPRIASQAAADKALVAELLQRRGRFLEVWLFPYGHVIEARDTTFVDAMYTQARIALAHLNEVRNTAAALAFLHRTPMFFERFDLRVFKEFRAGRLRE